MVAGFAEVADGKDFLVAGARYRPNRPLLSISYRSELIHCDCVNLKNDSDSRIVSNSRSENQIMLFSLPIMSGIRPTSQYALGNTDAEHERLIWQAERFAALTDRLFREAGIGAGQRVLDIGSGVGDVAMLAARLVGPSGEVVGVERDSRSIARARERVVEAGLRNVSFTQSDIPPIPDGKPFDAAVGRFILMWLQDPVSVLRSVSRWSVRVESLHSRSRIGYRFFRFWRHCPFGLRRLL
jgi:SAM-dependent methyltransferase